MGLAVAILHFEAIPWPRYAAIVLLTHGHCIIPSLWQDAYPFVGQSE